MFLDGERWSLDRECPTVECEDPLRSGEFKDVLLLWLRSRRPSSLLYIVIEGAESQAFDHGDEPLGSKVDV